MSAKIEDVFISKGYKPFWKLLFPYCCFAIAVYCIYDGWVKYTSDNDIFLLQAFMGSFLSALIFVVPGIYFARIQDFHFDFIRKKYKRVQRVGFIGFGSWKNFKDLEYVSLFENLDDNYQINLWYNTNKHFDIDTFLNYNEAVEVATDLAKKLEIDFHNSVEKYEPPNDHNFERKLKNSDRQVDVHITQGSRPVWKTILAILFLAFSIVLFFKFYNSLIIEVDKKYVDFDFISLALSFLMLVVSLLLAIVYDYQFDFKNDQFKHIYRVGPIKYGVWEPLESLDYVSVFQAKKGTYDVNLWYNTNTNVNFATYQEYDLALKIGKVLAKKLYIKVLDASDPHNSKWIEL